MHMTAKELLLRDKQELWNLPKGSTVNVSLDDGIVVNSKPQAIIFTRYCWDLLELYPNTPITYKCHVNSVLRDGNYTGETHILLLENIFKQICQHNGLNTYTQKEHLLNKVYIIVNNIFNDIVGRISAYVSTIDAMDFINVINDPEIVKIHEEFKPTPDSVDLTYKRIKNFMLTTQTPNRFVNAYRAGAINENQSNQCIGPRGFVTDLDRMVFRQPIKNGFIRGLSSLYDVMVESRTAAKSLNASETHVRDSEYASRRIQLLTMSVERVHNGDCGSTDYLDFLVTAKNIVNLKGKYYLNAEGGLSCIVGDEEHLHDKVVKLRHVLGCTHHNPKEVCSVCAGKVSENFKANSNLGYITTAYLMEKATQALLSTKHLTHSVKKSIIKLEGNANKYFYADLENDLYFNKDTNLAGMQLILPNNRVGKLVDVMNLPHVNVSLAKIGDLDDVTIRDTNHSTPINDVVTISFLDRSCVITRELLEYIKATKISSDARGNFIIPLDNYDKSKPVFNNPLKENNLVNFVKKMASMIETGDNKEGDIPVEKLVTLFDFVTEQFKCNLFVLEIMVYATTTQNSFNNNYRLGRNSQHPRCENRTKLFANRSFSQLAVFEKQIGPLIGEGPTMYNSTNRMDHPMDVLFEPGKVLERGY